jgi:transcriptional regulator with XRE-family HTH domain
MPSVKKPRTRLRALREALGLSPTEVGAKLGVSGALVGMWERGDRTPVLRTAKMLADLYGVDLDEMHDIIFGDTDADETSRRHAL